MDEFKAIDTKKLLSQQKTFIPKTISESIKITKENEANISFIETSESPSLESDLRYLLYTSIKSSPLDRLLGIARKPLRLFSEVKTDYYLTYHQKKDVPAPGRKQKLVKKYIGDEIIQVIRFSGSGADRNLLYYVTDFEVGGTRHSRDFLQSEGFIPVERFIGDKHPKWIIIGASPAATVMEGDGGPLGEKYLIIPGKINFRFRNRQGIYKYTARLISAADFLRRHPRIRKMARENNVEPAILTADKILVLERIDTSLGNVAGAFFKAFVRYRDMRYTLTGSFLFSFGIGMQQGAIINPILSMMESLGILVLLMWIMQYIFPNIVYTSSIILSAVRFDKIKAAEKDREVERVTINLELKKVIRKAAFSSVCSSFLLLLIYPGFFLSFVLHEPYVPFLIGFVFIAHSFLRDWPISFEQDTLFRILKHSLASDTELYGSILKINAFASSGEILINLLGIAVGWIAMTLSVPAGIALSVLGASLAFAKLLYPAFGSDYSASLAVNVAPFYISDHEVAVIPNKVYLRSPNRILMKKRNDSHVLYDEHFFEIVIADPGFEPRIKEKRRFLLSRNSIEWSLSWKKQKERAKISIRLKTLDKSFALGREQSEGTAVYRLTRD